MSQAAAGELGAQVGIQASRVIPPVAGLAILLGTFSMMILMRFYP